MLGANIWKQSAEQLLVQVQAAIVEYREAVKLAKSTSCMLVPALDSALQDLLAKAKRLGFTEADAYRWARGRTGRQ